MIPAIQSEKLAQRFGAHPVLEGLDLLVPEGAIYAYVGANGAGKTTTIKTLLNLVPSAGGSAQLLGRDSRSLTPADFREIGLVSEGLRLPLWMTVGEYLSYLQPFYPTWDQALADDLLRQFELPAGRKLQHLSRGMRMKAALVSTLAFSPRLLFLDEPFSGLDALVRDELIQALLARAERMTVFLSSHDLSEIESFSTHIGYLEGGFVRFSEEMAALVNRFREVEVTLSAPAELPAAWPAEWLQPESSGCLIRFVDSRHDPAQTAAGIRQLLSGVASIECRPMSLRDIFVVLARNAKKAA
ncbi:MAG: ABC transporter ATP-binding protein [Acidobacteria bacterium]|nr:ABC transporter ATP-binding protein [Acidobacteriota bacterium]